MKVIALTGGIGSGKSTVSLILKKLGAEVLDSDFLAHQVRDTTAFNEVVSTFGAQILTPQGKIDRRVLAGIVFQDPHLLAKLNQIIHPKLEEEINRRLHKLAEQNVKAVIIEIPLISAADWPARADEIWVVRTPADLILKRLKTRGVKEDEAQARMAHQPPVEQTVERPLTVIDNSGTPAELRQKVEKLWEGLHNKMKE